MAGTHGHIAVVVSVNADRTLTVEDYNWNYSRHYMLHKVGPGFFTRFVHFDDARVAGTTSDQPQPPPAQVGPRVTAAPSVHLRSGPGKSFGVVGELAHGAPVNIRCQARSSSTKQHWAVRDALGIKEGDEIAFRVEENRVLLARTPAFLDLAGTVPVPAAKRNVAWDDVVRTTRTARASRHR